MVLSLAMKDLFKKTKAQLAREKRNKESLKRDIAKLKTISARISKLVKLKRNERKEQIA